MRPEDTKERVTTALSSIASGMHRIADSLEVANRQYERQRETTVCHPPTRSKRTAWRVLGRWAAAVACWTCAAALCALLYEYRCDAIDGVESLLRYIATTLGALAMWAGGTWALLAPVRR